MSYPWHHALQDWAENLNLKIDALGLVTMLGATELDLCIGRLVSSPFFEFLPLLGAFVIAGNLFTEKRPGFTLYTISGGIVTTEVAGWLYRWIKSQDLETARTKVEWEVDERPSRWSAFFIGFLMVGLPANGVLIALTILSEDWWGFANAAAMTVSIIVKTILVHQNRRGIDRNLAAAKASRDRMVEEYTADVEIYKREYREYEAALQEYDAAHELLRAGQLKTRLPKEPLKPPRPIDPEASSKIIIVTDDSRAISMSAPEYLVKAFCTSNPNIHSTKIYGATRAIGWLAFVVHIISLGMSALQTQIYTVVLLLVATLLAVFRVGCEDFRTESRLAKGEEGGVSCWISYTLKATVSKFPPEWSTWECEQPSNKQKALTGQTSGVTTPSFASSTQVQANEKTATMQDGTVRRRQTEDLEANLNTTPAVGPVTTTSKTSKPKAAARRQDLFVWLQPTEEEDETMKMWNLVPRNPQWLRKYDLKKEEHKKRVEQQRSKTGSWTM